MPSATAVLPASRLVICARGAPSRATCGSCSDGGHPRPRASTTFPRRLIRMHTAEAPQSGECTVPIRRVPCSMTFVISTSDPSFSLFHFFTTFPPSHLPNLPTVPPSRNSGIRFGMIDASAEASVEAMHRSRNDRRLETEHVQFPAFCTQGPNWPVRLDPVLCMSHAGIISIGISISSCGTGPVAVVVWGKRPCPLCSINLRYLPHRTSIASTVRTARLYGVVSAGTLRLPSTPGYAYTYVDAYPDAYTDNSSGLLHACSATWVARVDAQLGPNSQYRQHQSRDRSGHTAAHHVLFAQAGTRSFSFSSNRSWTTAETNSRTHTLARPRGCRQDKGDAFAWVSHHNRANG